MGEGEYKVEGIQYGAGWHAVTSGWGYEVGGICSRGEI